MGIKVILWLEMVLLTADIEYTAGNTVQCHRLYSPCMPHIVACIAYFNSSMASSWLVA